MGISNGKIHVFVNNEKVELEAKASTGSDLLSHAGFTNPFEEASKHWGLYKLRSVNDNSGGTLISCYESITVSDGDWFRIIKGINHVSERAKAAV
jgi:hypothetical protein